MRTDWTIRTRDLTLEDTLKKTILLIDVACPNKYNKVDKEDEKIEKCHQLHFELR